MKLYTIQHENVYHKILKNKIYKTDKRFICSKTFKNAYDWMAKMMKKYKVFSPRPIFCYLNRPDLRTQRYCLDNRKENIINMVLIEIEVPAERVLVSDFDLWHFILNDFAIYLNKEDTKWKGKENNKNYLKFKKQSWERCLDLPINDFSKYPKDLKGSGIKQACVPEIKLEYITNIIPFKMINIKKSI